MYIIPAIDLLEGKCVRLIQGEYHRQITYQDDPVKQAKKFSSAGAQWVHIVDLGGAKVGGLVNTDAISAIAALGKLRVEVGGGIRDEASIRQLLDMGIERVIIGTKAVSDFDWFCEMAEKFNRKLALALDVRGSKVATHAWIYTDISKDGMMAGPNFERTRGLVEAVQIPVIASGGVGQVSDIKKLAGLGAEAVIIGRALYEGTLNLSDALNAAK